MSRGPPTNHQVALSNVYQDCDVTRHWPNEDGGGWGLPQTHESYHHGLSRRTRKLYRPLISTKTHCDVGVNYTGQKLGIKYDLLDSWILMGGWEAIGIIGK